MQPFQLWLPEIVSDHQLLTLQQDRSLAFRHWEGEDVVWLLPGHPGPRRWRDQGGLRSLAIGAQDIDRIEIYHVGKNGFVVGPDSPSRFPDGKAMPHLDAWLNCRVDPKWDWGHVPGIIPVNVPEFGRKRVALVERQVEISPRYAVPSPSESGEAAKARVTFPAHGMSRNFVDSQRPKPFHDVPADDRDIALLALQWPAPIGSLMPLLSGWPELRDRKQMLDVVRLSRTKPEQAVYAARRFASEYLSEGTSTVWASELAPILAAEQEDGFLFYLENHFRIEAESLSDFRKKFSELASRPVPIRRAWGPLGLFWALLLNALEEGGRWNTCGKCGRLIPARRNKHFCGTGDSQQCYRSRRTSSQSRYRARAAELALPESRSASVKPGEYRSGGKRKGA